MNTSVIISIWTTGAIWQYRWKGSWVGFSHSSVRVTFIQLAQNKFTTDTILSCHTLPQWASVTFMQESVSYLKLTVEFTQCAVLTPLHPTYSTLCIMSHSFVCAKLTWSFFKVWFELPCINYAHFIGTNTCSLWLRKGRVDRGSQPDLGLFCSSY